LSLGVTLLTVYGKEIVEFTANLFKADEAFTLSSESQTKYYNKLTQIIEKRIDAQLKLNVLNKTMTEQQARDFKANYEKSKDVRDAESQFYEERLEIAKQFSRDIQEVNGELPTTPPEGTKQMSYSFKRRLEENARINDAFKEAEKRKEETIRQIGLQYKAEKDSADKEDEDNKNKQSDKAIKKAESDAEKKAAAEKKATKEGREAEAEYDEIWKKERKKLNDWIYESETNRFEWEQQNIKTQSDAEIDAANATKDAIAKIRKKKFSEMNEEEKKEYRKQLAEKAQEEFNITLNFLDQLNRIKSDKTDKYLSNEIDKRQRNIQQQQQLAAQGLEIL
jgi:hypothetical protein